MKAFGGRAILGPAVLSAASVVCLRVRAVRTGLGGIWPVGINVTESALALTLNEKRAFVESLVDVSVLCVSLARSQVSLTPDASSRLPRRLCHVE